ncbi:hypothetical protein [Embleya sp. AB8]|uniref:hypothetical protein n=1 Tax=Embleya sp. AB8 TaxID=3156304 RepID=UPI003C74C3DA
MAARPTDRRHPISAPLAACAVCAVAGAILCLAVAHRSGFAADLGVLGLLRRPAPVATLVFGLSGLLVALRGGPSGKNRLNPPRERPHPEDSAERR